MKQSSSILYGQIALDGHMPYELGRSQCEHYQMFALQGWNIMSRIAYAARINIWRLKNESAVRPTNNIIEWVNTRRPQLIENHEEET